MIGRASKPAFPPGHFYSPVVDPGEIDAARIWPERPDISGIEFNDASHRQVLERDFPRFYPDYDYPDDGRETPTLKSFFTNNSQFGWLDSRALFVLLRAWSPRRVIEVGSGFSSLLIADVNRRWFGCGIDLCCIEPYPRPFLRDGILGLSRLVEARVQDVAMAEFQRLQAGDFLFIDSSHVAKTGSDVNFLFFDVFPRLAAGVRIHLHDIFLPHDYPRAWVLEENRSWNEQYLLRALLMHTGAFEVLFGCSYAFWRFPDRVAAALAHPDGAAYGGGSFWMRRV